MDIRKTLIIKETIEADGAGKACDVRSSRKCQASRAAVLERIAAEPAYNGSFTPESSRSWAGRKPAGMCQEETYDAVNCPLFFASSPRISSSRR